MKYDLVLVGTGIATNFFLHKIAKEYKNKNILVLERGFYETHSEKIKNRDERDFGTVISKIKPSATYINNSEKPWVYNPSFGGSSNCWYGCTPRMLPNDFKLASKYNIGFDLPIEYNEL